MRELTKSMLRLAWGLPLYGAARLLDGHRDDRPAERLGSSLDAVAWSGHRRLGGLFQALFQTGDDFGREWVDRFFDAVDRGRTDPLAAASGLVSSAAGIAGDGLRATLPGAAGGAARREWRNKLEVFLLVRDARARLGLPAAGEPFELPAAVDRALELDPRSALWVLEGLGHDHAAGALVREPNPAGLLAAGNPPPAALLMLHAGLGLAVAEHVLGALTPAAPTPGEVARALERFAELCHANSRPGFAPAALESLGLVNRCFFPDLVPPVDRELRRMSGPLPGYFWHGVGRAIYFLPVQFLPGYGSSVRALAMARREAPDPPAAHNALAGVVYALTLVNLSHPQVVEDLLRREGEALRAGAFTEGLVSALRMRRATTPADPDLGAFLRHRPGRGDARLAGRWRELIAEPAAEAFAETGAPDRGAPDRGVPDRGTPDRGSPDGGGEVYRALAKLGSVEVRG